MYVVPFSQRSLKSPPRRSKIAAWALGTLCCLLAPWGSGLWAPAATIPENVILERDVEYGKAGDRSLKLDILRPKDVPADPLPVIVFVHGGGWRGGNKAHGIPLLAPFAATGKYFCVSVSYRFSNEAVWPAQIHDCKAAIRWLRASAKRYHIDPDRIGCWGISAGGHLVSLLGATGDVQELEGNCGSAGFSSRVACVVDFCGPTDLLAFALLPDGESPKLIQQLIGGSFAEKREVAKAASPLSYVSKDDAPILIVHGTKDHLVPFAQAETFYAALKKAGVAATLVRIEGGGHGNGGPEAHARVTAFFDKYLRGQQVEVSEQPILLRPLPSK
jgi:acetyl esterase/lipase